MVSEECLGKSCRWFEGKADSRCFKLGVLPNCSPDLKARKIKQLGGTQTMQYQLVQFCPGCIQDILDGEICFTEAVCITEVPNSECDNFEVDGEILYEQKVAARGTIELED